MFPEENGEFILNYWLSRKSLLFQGKNTELVEKKIAEIISKVADDKVVHLVDEIFEHEPKKVTKNVIAQTMPTPLKPIQQKLLKSETFVECRRGYSKNSQDILVDEKEKDQVNHDQQQPLKTLDNTNDKTTKEPNCSKSKNTLEQKLSTLPKGNRNLTVN